MVNYPLKREKSKNLTVTASSGAIIYKEDLPAANRSKKKVLDLGNFTKAKGKSLEGRRARMAGMGMTVAANEIADEDQVKGGISTYSAFPKTSALGPASPPNGSPTRYKPRIKRTPPEKHVSPHLPGRFSNALRESRMRTPSPPCEEEPPHDSHQSAVQEVLNSARSPNVRRLYREAEVSSETGLDSSAAASPAGSTAGGEGKPPGEKASAKRMDATYVPPPKASSLSRALVFRSSQPSDSAILQRVADVHAQDRQEVFVPSATDTDDRRAAEIAEREQLRAEEKRLQRAKMVDAGLMLKHVTDTYLRHKGKIKQALSPWQKGTPLAQRKKSMMAKHRDYNEVFRHSPASTPLGLGGDSGDDSVTSGRKKTPRAKPGKVYGVYDAVSDDSDDDGGAADRMSLPDDDNEEISLTVPLENTSARPGLSTADSPVHIHTLASREPDSRMEIRPVSPPGKPDLGPAIVVPMKQLPRNAPASGRPQRAITSWEVNGGSSSGASAQSLRGGSPSVGMPGGYQGQPAATASPALSGAGAVAAGNMAPVAATPGGEAYAGAAEPDGVPYLPSPSAVFAQSPQLLFGHPLSASVPLHVHLRDNPGLDPTARREMHDYAQANPLPAFRSIKSAVPDASGPIGPAIGTPTDPEAAAPTGSAFATQPTPKPASPPRRPRHLNSVKNLHSSRSKRDILTQQPAELPRSPTRSRLTPQPAEPDMPALPQREQALLAKARAEAGQRVELDAQRRSAADLLASTFTHQLRRERSRSELAVERAEKHKVEDLRRGVRSGAISAAENASLRRSVSKLRVDMSGSEGGQSYRADPVKR